MFSHAGAGAAIVTAFAVVLALTPVVERWARGRGMVDRPGGRHLHARPVPRLGGVAIFAGLMGGAAVLYLSGAEPRRLGAVLAGTALVWLVGLIDDVRFLSPAAKLAGQAAAATVSVLLGLRVEFVSLPPMWGHDVTIWHLGGWGAPLTVAWLIGVANAVNLLDGLDGLAAGVVAIAAVPSLLAAASLGFMEAAGLLAILAAACLAFLRYNFSPARIFMGDSGALMLGFAFAAASALGSTKGPATFALVVPVMSLGVPLLDTGWAILRRAFGHQPLAHADNGHLHYLLLARWGVPWRVVLVLYATSAALGAMALAVTPQGRILLAPALALGALAVAMIVRAGLGRTPAAHQGREALAVGLPGDAGLRDAARGHQAGPRHRSS